MRSFEYFTPTRVVFGKDTHLKVATLLKEQHCKKVLIHYGGHSAIKSGLIDEIRSVLDEAGIAYVTLGGVVPNPRLTYTLPQYQTESGCVDILMHTMERYFVNIETMEITDSISESLMQTVIYNSRILLKEPDNYTARAEIMWAGSLSHNGLTGCGTGGGDWACHQLEHELGGTYDVAHGAGLAALWGSWARYVYDANPERFAQFATNVFEIPCSIDFNKTALAGIEAMEDYFRSIQMPTSLHELGLDLTEKDIHDLAFKCSYEDTRTIGVFKQLNMKDMEKIYLAAR